MKKYIARDMYAVLTPKLYHLVFVWENVPMLIEPNDHTVCGMPLRTVKGRELGNGKSPHWLRRSRPKGLRICKQCVKAAKRIRKYQREQS